MKVQPSESWKRLEDNFMKERQAGKSIPEIAKKYGVSFGIVYRKLDRIAVRYGVTRDSLLQVVMSPKPRRDSKVTKKKYHTAREAEQLIAEGLEIAARILGGKQHG